MITKDDMSAFRWMLDSVKENGLALKDATDIMKNCDTIVMAAVEENWEALQYQDEKHKTRFLPRQ